MIKCSKKFLRRAHPLHHSDSLKNYQMPQWRLIYPKNPAFHPGNSPQEIFGYQKLYFLQNLSELHLIDI